ncbi:MAG: (deoxy)nucleoside triphosphate pyrophosphohydrolase [Prosthecobacter sp.]
MDPALPVFVVCAILFREGRILLAQRPPGKKLAGMWEFAGGKIEPGESAENALHRELQEELGCEVSILRELAPVTHDYPWCRVVMTPFICELAPGSAEPHPHEHTELAWVKPENLRDYDLAPADLPVVEALNATPV